MQYIQQTPRKSILAFSNISHCENMTVTSNVSSNSQSFGTQRANQYRRLKIVHRSIYQWFGSDPSAKACTGPDNGVCAFGPPDQNTFGSSKNGSVRGPGYLNADLSAFTDRKVEQVADLAKLPTTGNLGPWVGLDSDDSPLLLKDTGTQDVYALDWQAH